MDLMTLSAKLSLDSSSFESGLRKGEQDFKGFGDKLSAWTVAKGKLIADLAKTAVSSLTNAAKDALNEGMGFDKAMSQVAATMGKTMDEMNTTVGTAILNVDGQTKEFTGNLTEFARFMGANTAFSATQAADALNYMALAGYDAQTSMDMLPNVLNLAAAGNMDLARASDQVTDVSSALGLSMDETRELVDKMAVTASKTNTSVEQLGDSMLSLGADGKKVQGGTTEITALLGVLANNGVKGATAGTKLGSILTRLSAPMNAAKKEMKKLGLQVYDTTGRMRSMPDILEDLNKALDGMTDEQKSDYLRKIFGADNTSEVLSLLAMTREEWDSLMADIDASDGAASQMAETQLDNLAGDTVKWGSALSEAKIILSDALTPTLRKFVQFGTKSLSRLTDAYKKGGLEEVGKEFNAILDETIESLKNSDNATVAKFGNALDAIRKAINWLKLAVTDFPSAMKQLGNWFKSISWPTWEDVKAAAINAWDRIKDGVSNIANTAGKLIFGEKEDGSVNWPAWEDIKQGAIDLWNTIKEKALAIATELGGVIFGKKADGSVAWPTWEDVKAGAEQFWKDIQTKALNIGKELGGLVFGKKEDGSVDFPDATSIGESITTWWDSVKPDLKIQFPTVDQLVEDLRGKLNGAIDWLNSWTGLNLQHIGEEAFTIDPTAAIDDTEELANKYISDLERLTDMYGEGATYLPIWQATVRNLTTLIPDLGDKFDDQTGKIKGNTDELRENVKQWAELARQQALASAMQDEKQKMADAASEAAKAEIEYNNAMDELNKVQDKMAKVHQSIMDSDYAKTLGLDKISEYQIGEGDSADEIARKTGLLYSMWGRDLNLSQKAGALGITEEEVSDLELYIDSYDELGRKVEATKAEWDSANAAFDLAKTRYESYSETITSLMASAESATASARSEVERLNAALAGISTAGASGYAGLSKAVPKAKGDWNVPYDNFPAMLHRGEMVLTSSQARDYRSGNNGGIDTSGLTSAIIAAVREGMNNATVRSYLDGSEITDVVNRRNMNGIKARRFAT